PEHSMNEGQVVVACAVGLLPGGIGGMGGIFGGMAPFGPLYLRQRHPPSHRCLRPSEATPAGGDSLYPGCSGPPAIRPIARTTTTLRSHCSFNGGQPQPKASVSGRALGAN